MSETSQVTFTHREITEALIKSQDIHEGLWAIYIQFGLGTANIPGPGATKDSLLPAAIIPVLKIGIQKVERPNPLSVDAAEVNPRTEGDVAPVSKGSAP